VPVTVTDTITVTDTDTDTDSVPRVREPDTDRDTVTDTDSVTDTVTDTDIDTVCTLTMLGSQDESSLIVSFYPPQQAAFGFGHVDLFYAQDADDLVWSPIYQWLSTHEGE
jgi:hypothetical protein